MSHWGLTRYLKVPKHFDAQLEVYLLKDSKRRERAETTISIGDIQYHEAKVKIQGEWVEKEWLTITGVVVNALVEGEEIILASFKGQMVHCKTPPFLEYRKEVGRLT